ncbi:hypothetical protein RHGRI_010472 [Rhododendron griersonianum]|uniref:F-box associated beta-propeller type 1 domain-containing protein n=1 Tax=Rhododendron griersonianum TaxID=479676 RepID=A0AAV6KIS6_9ERIC|nr:hypothetical protein RHGRI_010472 [Rhododendron griersonianum]
MIEHYSFRLDNSHGFDEYAEHESPTKNPGSRFHIFGSCNGLLCLYGCIVEKSFPILLLWNPLVGKGVAVPGPGVGGWFQTFGFGFDELRNDHKVVAILALDIQGFQPQVEIYSLNSGMWREISPEALRCPVPFKFPQAYLNGVAHWVATDPRTQSSDAKRSCIVTFSFKYEVFGEMMLPETGSMLLEITMEYLTVLQDSLSFINIANDLGDGEHSSCWVWVMEKYGVEESWTLLFRVDTSSVLDWPVGFRMNGELAMETREASLVSYDPESKQVKDLGIRGCELVQNENARRTRSFYMGKYVESLILLEREASAPEHMGTSDEYSVFVAEFEKAVDVVLRILTGEEV